MTTITLNGTMTLGRLLALYRQTTGLDQTEMGERVGASRATVSAWESDRRDPSFAQVVTWAKIAGQPLEPLAEAIETTDQKVGGSSPSRRALLRQYDTACESGPFVVSLRCPCRDWHGRGDCPLGCSCGWCAPELHGAFWSIVAPLLETAA